MPRICGETAAMATPIRLPPMSHYAKVTLTVVAVLLLSLPGLFPHGADWVLPGYWSSLPAFLGHEFPAKALLISLVAAVIPVLGAVPLFRRQAY